VDRELNNVNWHKDAIKMSWFVTTNAVKRQLSNLTNMCCVTDSQCNVSHSVTVMTLTIGL